MALARLEAITLGSRRQRRQFLQLHTDIRHISRGFRRLGKKTTNRAVRKSLNQALSKTNTQAKRSIAGFRNLKISDVGRKLKPIRARTNLTAQIRGEGRPISLMQLRSQPVQIKKGVRVKTRKGAAPTLLQGAFIARMPNGRFGVFQRKGKERFPIREHTLPSIAHTLVQKEISDPLREFAHDQFKERLRANLNRELARLPGAAPRVGLR